MSVKRIAAVTLGLSSLTALGACAATLTLEIDFPNETAVLISSNADITLVPVTAPDADRCASLLGMASVSEGTRIESVPICDLRSYALPDPGGATAVLVRVLDDTNTVILEGCSIVDVYPGRGTAQVELFPTDQYAARLMRDPPSPGASLEARCGGGS